MKKEDLKPGMLIDDGLVLGVYLDGQTANETSSKIFAGEPHMLFVCRRDPYYGPGWRSIQDDTEFEILYEQGTPEYRNVVKEMISKFLEFSNDSRMNALDLLKFL